MHQLPFMRKKCIASAVVVASSLFAVDAWRNLAHAQEIYLEEVVVSAQKRDENIQEVPITLNAFTSDFIEQAAARNIGDLETYTPGLEVERRQRRSPNSRCAVSQPTILVSVPIPRWVSTWMVST
jgi:outer membrane receptor protein involved in Fe transport